MKQNIVSIYLIVIGILFIGFGLAYLFFPTQMIAFTGMETPTATAKADIWAIYAGIQIGFGLYLLLCSRNSELFKAGLLSIVFIFGGVAIGRMIGILYFEAYDHYSLFALLCEWTGTFVAMWLYTKLNRNVPNKNT